MTGWSSGPGWADESGGSAGSTASSTASGAEPATAKPSVTGAEAGKGDDDRPTGKPGTSKGSYPASAKPTKRKAPAPVSTIADAKPDAGAPATATHNETTDAD